MIRRTVDVTVGRTSSIPSSLFSVYSVSPPPILAVLLHPSIQETFRRKISRNRLGTDSCVLAQWSFILRSLSERRITGRWRTSQTQQFSRSRRGRSQLSRFSPPSSLPSSNSSLPGEFTPSRIEDSSFPSSFSSFPSVSLAGVPLRQFSLLVTS